MKSPESAQITDMILMRIVRLLVKYWTIAPVHTESQMMKTSALIQCAAWMNNPSLIMGNYKVIFYYISPRVKERAQVNKIERNGKKIKN